MLEPVELRVVLLAPDAKLPDRKGAGANANIRDSCIIEASGDLGKHKRKNALPATDESLG